MLIAVKNKLIASFIIIFGTFSFPVGTFTQHKLMFANFVNNATAANQYEVGQCHVTDGLCVTLVNAWRNWVD